ncbi:MAG: hypothetical protein KAQ89_03700 [Planctomycetes bacterium]|nr:hypothetical protein [Planctomycetota bacterium]
MLREKRLPQDDESGGGAPKWMVTFSDCMTLLLTFFVLLLSFSSFDEKVFLKLETIFANNQHLVAAKDKKEKEAFLSAKQIQTTEELSKGSEKPTLEKGDEDNLKKEDHSLDFRDMKVFLIPSNEIFWGRGVILSNKGRKILATMANFIEKVPNRIVVSENSYEDENNNNENSGLSRAWAIVEYLTNKQGLSKTRFSISSASTLKQETLKKTRQDSKTSRHLEIVLLEEGIYN